MKTKDVLKQSFTFFFLHITFLVILSITLSFPNDFLQYQHLSITNIPNAHGTIGNTLPLDPSQFTESQEETYRESILDILPANMN